MSIEAMNWALDVQTDTPGEKLVLLILANRANHNGECWPGAESIGFQASMTERGVIKIMRKLEAKKLLSVTKRAKTGGKQTTNLYRLDIRGELSSALNTETFSPEHSSPLSPELSSPEPKDNPNKNPKSTRTGARTSVPKSEHDDWEQVPGLNHAAYRQWLEDRRRRRLKPYKTLKVARELATLTHEQQQRCVEHSLDEYIGIFPKDFANDADLRGRNAGGGKTLEQLIEDNERRAGLR